MTADDDATAFGAAHRLPATASAWCGSAGDYAS
jgi:hypothetical protein